MGAAGAETCTSQPQRIDPRIWPNAADAAKLARALNAKHAVPVHYGMLDDCSPDAFDYEGKAVLEDGVEYDIQENEL